MIKLLKIEQNYLKILFFLSKTLKEIFLMERVERYHSKIYNKHIINKIQQIKIINEILSM